MRWYDITFTGNTGPAVPGLPLNYRSLDDRGNHNPGALEVDFDIINAAGHFATPASRLRIHNVPLSICQKALSYQGMQVQISAGFSDTATSGFKLAKTAQAGVIGFGAVQACIPNYMGTEMVMDFIIIPSISGSPDLDLSSSENNGPRNYAFEWQVGQSFMEAIGVTFKRLGYKVTGGVSSKLKNNTGLPVSWVGGTYEKFCTFINDRTRNIVDPPVPGQIQTYDGVSISSPSLGTVLISDNTWEGGIIPLFAEEFIGQPSIFTPLGLEVQSVLPLRSDIMIAGYVSLPVISTLVATSVGGVPGTQSKPLTASSKKLRVTQVRHLGRFRDSSAQGWVSIVTAGSALQPLEA